MIDTQEAIANSTDVKYVVKRTGERETFQTEKIKHAIIKAMNSAGTADEDLAEKVYLFVKEFYPKIDSLVKKLEEM